MTHNNQTNRKNGGITLAWLVGYLSYENGWGFNPSADYSTDEYWEYVQGYEAALAEAQS